MSPDSSIGWDIYSVPSAQITHLEGRASYIKQSRLYFLYEGQYIYFRKVYGIFGCRLIFAITQLKSYIRIFSFFCWEIGKDGLTGK